MNTDNFFIADPYKDEHIKLFMDFENANDYKRPVTTYLTGIRKAYDKESYNKIVRNNNELNIIIFMMNKNKMSDYCYIKGEKDRKVCELFFAHLNFPSKNRHIMEKASFYALNILGMEQVFVSIAQEEKDLYHQLINSGYEDIGEVNGKRTLIKEKEEIKEVSKVI